MQRTFCWSKWSRNAARREKHGFLVFMITAIYSVIYIHLFSKEKGFLKIFYPFAPFPTYVIFLIDFWSKLTLVEAFLRRNCFAIPKVNKGRLRSTGGKVGELMDSVLCAHLPTSIPVPLSPHLLSCSPALGYPKLSKSTDQLPWGCLSSHSVSPLLCPHCPPLQRCFAHTNSPTSPMTPTSQSFPSWLFLLLTLWIIPFFQNSFLWLFL